MRLLFILLALCIASCAATTAQEKPPARDRDHDQPAPRAKGQPLQPLREAVRAAAAAAAEDHLDEAIAAAKHADEILGEIWGTSEDGDAAEGAGRDAAADPATATELRALEAEINERLRPSLRERLLRLHGERYGILSEEQLDMIWDRGVPTGQLFLGPERRCWRFDHGPGTEGCTLSCWNKEGALDLEMVSTPAVLQVVEAVAQQPGQMAKDQVGILLAKGLPVQQASSAARTCWIYETRKTYELYCWTQGRTQRLDHYEEVHPSVAFDLGLFERAESQYGARTPGQVRTLLHLGLPKSQKTLENGQRCWLYPEAAEGAAASDRLEAQCWNQAGQLTRYRHVTPAILPDFERLGSKYDARTPGQLDLILELGPPQSQRGGRGEPRCWSYPTERYCFDSAGGLVEHTASGKME